MFRRRTIERESGQPLPDGDTVLAPGETQRFVELFRRAWSLPTPEPLLPSVGTLRGGGDSLHARPPGWPGC